MKTYHLGSRRKKSMAIGTPSESPAIVVTEIDRSGVVPNVQTTTGAFVGNFNWGPVNRLH